MLPGVGKPEGGGDGRRKGTGIREMRSSIGRWNPQKGENKKKKKKEEGKEKNTQMAVIDR